MNQNSNYPQDETDLTAEQLAQLAADGEKVELTPGPWRWSRTTFADVRVRVTTSQREPDTSNPAGEQIPA